VCQYHRTLAKQRERTIAIGDREIADEQREDPLWVALEDSDWSEIAGYWPSEYAAP
jgi:hypothetical protein